MNLSEHNALVYRLYEAAGVPALWPAILEDIGSLIKCDTAVIYEIDGNMVGSFVATPSAKILMAHFLDCGHTDFRYFESKIPLYSSPNVTPDRKKLSESKLDDRFYNEFLFQNSAALAVWTVLRSTDGEMVIVGFLRAEEFGPISVSEVGRLNLFRPYFGRAVDLLKHVAYQSADSVVQVFEMLGQPAAVLRRSGQLRRANESFRKLMPGLIDENAHGLTFLALAPDRSFRKALGQPSRPSSFPVEGRAFYPAHVAHIRPLEHQNRDILASLDFILTLVPVEAKNDIDVSLLKGLFSLTPSEARVARSVLLGLSPAEIARDVGVTIRAIRFHLSNVMAKTGTTRQAELVGLLSSIRIASSATSR